MAVTSRSQTRRISTTKKVSETNDNFMTIEPWLNGAIDGMPKMLMPAAHALMQAQQDITRYASNLTFEELWMTPNGAPSAGFHLLHINGSIDRLLTYTKGETLSPAQFEFLKHEQEIAPTETAEALIQAVNNRIAETLSFMESLPETEYFAERFVGRAKLKTNVFGLIFHIAEHTQRHVGSLIVVSKIVRSHPFNQ